MSTTSWRALAAPPCQSELQLQVLMPEGGQGTSPTKSPGSKLATPRTRLAGSIVLHSTRQSVALGPQADEQICVPYGPLTTAGELWLSITLDGQHVADSPRPPSAAGIRDASSSELRGGGRGNSAVALAGQAATFDRMRDKYGNPMTPQLDTDEHSALHVELVAVLARAARLAVRHCIRASGDDDADGGGDGHGADGRPWHAAEAVALRRAARCG